MTAKRLYYLLLGLTALLMLAIVGGAYGINSLLAGQATKVANLKLETQSLNQQQAGLAKAKKDIATYSSLEQITQSIVPQDKDQAEAVREIVNIAAGANVTLTNIAFPASNLGAGVVPTGVAGSSAAASPTTSSAAAGSKSALSQLTAVPNIPGVYELVITIQNDQSTEVSYTEFYHFLAALEKNRRTAEVSNIVITPDTKDRTELTFTLSLNEYIKPS